MFLKPFSQACENNKAPILAVLRDAFCEATRALEIGSGSGQHAVHFGGNLPWLRWQPSDVAANIAGIKLWLAEAGLANVPEPAVLDVTQLPWGVASCDAIFTANTLHIMGKPGVECFFRGLQNVLQPGGALCVYGPFNYAGSYTSDSNARFDQWLFAQHPDSAIRDFEWVNQLASEAGLVLVEDYAMPANNRLLHWRKSAPGESA